MKKVKEYPQEFLEICDWVNEKVAKKRAILNLEKTEKRQLQMLLGAIMALMTFIIIAFANQTLKTIAWLIFMIAFAILVFYSFLENLKILKKKVEFKEIVLEEFAVHLKDGFTYEQNGEISESKYRKSGFDKAYNEFFSNSYMEGQKNGRNIGVANVIIKKRQKNNELKETFKGAFAFANLNSIVKEIDIMKVNSTKNTREKFCLEEADLYMYSDNIDYAKKIIDKSIVDEIVKIKKEFNITLEVMINKDMLYIRFFIDNMNNTLLYATEKERDILYKYYRIINFMELIARKIDSNILGKSEDELLINNNLNNSNNSESNDNSDINSISNLDKDSSNTVLVNSRVDLSNFTIFPKTDLNDISEEFIEILSKSEGVEIQLFDEKGKTSEVDITSKINDLLNKYPNIKEITVHPPIFNYDLEHILFKNEKIFEKQLHEIVNLSKKLNIRINLLYHTTWNIDIIISTGLINKLNKYLKILEGTDNKLLIENVYIISENNCTPLYLCKILNHPNLKVCLDITHVKVKSNIYKANEIEYIRNYLDKELCEKYVYQIHFASTLNNDGYIDKKTHGRVHVDENSMLYDLNWMKEYNLLNKIIVTEISEDDYLRKPDQIKEIKMLENVIQKIN